MNIEGPLRVDLDLQETFAATFQLYARTWPKLGLVCLAVVLVAAACSTTRSDGLLLTCWLALPPLAVSSYLHLLHGSQSSSPAVFRLDRVLASAAILLVIFILGTIAVLVACGLAAAIWGPLCLLALPGALLAAATIIPSFLPLAVLSSMPLDKAWFSSARASVGLRGTLFTFAMVVGALELLSQYLVAICFTGPLAHNGQVVIAPLVLLSGALHLALGAFPLAALYMVTESFCQQGCLRDVSEQNDSAP